MKEEVLPSFIRDLQESLSVSVKTTPLEIDFSKPSIIICSESSVIEKRGKEFFLKSDKKNQHYTPDINKLFTSFAKYEMNFDMNVLIMTGIGNDGVEGAALLKSKGAKVFAQDEKRSPVYGMPKAACERGIVDKVLSLDEIKVYLQSL